MGTNDIEVLRNSGTIPVANLKIFDAINNLKFSDYVLDHEQYTMTMYKQYFSNVKSMSSEEEKAFLKIIKYAEIIDNQSFEYEDAFISALYLEQVGENCIDYLLQNSTSTLSRDCFIKGHKILLRGTKNQKYANNDYRVNNDSFVCKNVNGKIKITYFSIPYTDINEAINNIVKFYNSDCYDEHIFLKSQIIHALVACLQIFDDGNTRYARILQNMKLYQLTRNNFDNIIDTPILYGTKSYFPYRDKYRNLICNIVVDPNQDNWDKWFEFNLNRVEDQMYFLDDKIEYYKKLVK